MIAPGAVDRVQLGVAVLRKRRTDPKVKLLGFDGDLGAIADALEELADRQTALRAAFNAFLAHFNIGQNFHTDYCECEPCALARMVKWSTPQ